MNGPLSNYPENVRRRIERHEREGRVLHAAQYAYVLRVLDGVTPGEASDEALLHAITRQGCGYLWVREIARARNLL